MEVLKRSFVIMKCDIENMKSANLKGLVSHRKGETSSFSKKRNEQNIFLCFRTPA